MLQGWMLLGHVDLFAVRTDDVLWKQCLFFFHDVQSLCGVGGSSGHYELGGRKLGPGIPETGGQRWWLGIDRIARG